MAFVKRDIEKIREDAITYLKTLAILYDEADENKLNGPSNAAVWYNLVTFFATTQAQFEMLFEDFEKAMNELALSIPAPNLRWYAAETLKYQHGDSLTEIDGITRYVTVKDEDDESRVITLSSTSFTSGKIIVKAAKEDDDGNVIPLSTNEKSGLESYWLYYRPPGDVVQVISQDADKTKVYARIEVDGNKIDVNGEDINGDRVVDIAIRDYLKNLDFNGRFLRMKLEDSIQGVDGVVNVVITGVEVQADGVVGYSNILTGAAQDYVSIAGFMKESDDTTFEELIEYVVV